MNPNGTVKNLRPPWRKGEPSPNPSGRARRLPISDTYASLADVPIPESVRKVMKRKGVTLDSGATFAEALALGVWMRALAGDPGAAKELRESMEGKASPRPVAPSGPVELVVRYPDPIKTDLSEPDPATDSPSDKKT